MLARVYSCAVIGLEGVVVEVEVDASQGLPNIVIVGLPDAAVQESRERVQSAIKNSGLYFPRKRITVNLAPAAVRKEGPAYDLPIATGILIASAQIPPEGIEGSLVIGELSLDGSVRHVRGVLSMAALAREQGFERIFVPAIDAAEAALIPDVEVIPVPSLSTLAAHLFGETPIPPQPPIAPDDLPPQAHTDFSEVKGQEHVKRALEVAASGGHNVLMVGPPGAGKTLLARSLPGILPHMSIDESLDVTRIYSIADQLPPDVPLVRNRPFRAPHHTISHAGLVGGGNWPHPGEISLAHRGVLFLDELPEFGPRVLEVMRQPIEDKVLQQHRHPLPEAHLGTPARPHRHPHRSAARRVRKAEQRPHGRALRRNPGTCGGGPPNPAQALQGRPAAELRGRRRRRGVQRRHGRGRGAPALQAGRHRALADAQRHEPTATIGSRLPPHPETVPHHRRPGGCREHRAQPFGGGAAVPAEGDGLRTDGCQRIIRTGLNGLGTD
ncbi:MAG: YifB family Mg chelatase-like AAA ATPase [Anaerolineales bacterium]